MKNGNDIIVDDEDYIECPICSKQHRLVQGEISGIRIGDGVLFYTCNNEHYIGAINKRLVFGTKLCQ